MESVAGASVEPIWYWSPESPLHVSTRLGGGDHLTAGGGPRRVVKANVVSCVREAWGGVRPCPPAEL